MVNKRKQSRAKAAKTVQKKSYKNLLVMRPVQNCRWEYEDESNTKIIIFFPRFQSRLGKKIGESYNLKMDRKLHLDDYGSAVWKLCDGKTTVREIADVLSEQFGDAVDPLYPRLAEFLRILERNEFIDFKELKSVKSRNKKQ